MPTICSVCSALVASALLATASGCGNDEDKPSATPSQSTPSASSSATIDASAGESTGS